MPQIKVRAVKAGSAVLVVGNGPSGHVVKWPTVRQRLVLGCKGKLDLVLINKHALGKTAPTYAVAVGPEILREFQRDRLWDRSTIITNAPHKVVGPDDTHHGLGDLFLNQNVLHGMDRWPPHASGPLSVWAMAALGYERIFLYSMDGTVATPDGVECGDDRLKSYKQVALWENWTRRFLESRQRSLHAAKTARPKLVRVWPDKRWDGIRDPLGPALAQTRTVE